jgi:hypothetical protein
MGIDIPTFSEKGVFVQYKVGGYEFRETFNQCNLTPSGHWALR